MNLKLIGVHRQPKYSSEKHHKDVYGHGYDRSSDNRYVELLPFFVVAFFAHNITSSWRSKQNGCEIVVKV